MNARLVATRVLTRVEEDGAFSNLALMAELGAFPRAQEADRGLVTELVLGVLRNQRLLDAWVGHLTERPDSLAPVVRRILRLSLYQLIALDRIPAHAVLHEAGELCRRLRQPRAVGLVNAVLRRFLREREARPLPPLPADPVRRLAVQASIPDWLMDRWRTEQDDGDSPEGLARLQERARSVNSPAPLTLAVNPRRSDPDTLLAEAGSLGLPCSRGNYLDSALILGTGGFGLMTRLVSEGRAHVMDEAAQLVTRLLDPGEGEQVLDLCAAPGGKSLWIAGRVGAGGRVVSVDISDTKLELLRRQADTFGFHWVETLQADASSPIPALAGQRFDRVLVDAPCSALGLIRRHPEIRWRRQEADIPALAQTAHAIARLAMNHVRPGGRLVFSVCTTSREEGPAQVAALAGESGWELHRDPTIPAELWRTYEGFDHLDTRDAPSLDGFVAFALVRPLSE